MAIKIIALSSEPNETILPQESAKGKKYLSSSFSNAFGWINCHIFTILDPIKTKHHFIPHVILVQMIHKRSRDNKMAAEHC